jgi:hypothetical protein
MKEAKSTQKPIRNEQPNTFTTGKTGREKIERQYGSYAWIQPRALAKTKRKKHVFDDTGDRPYLDELMVKSIEIR